MPEALPEIASARYLISAHGSQIWAIYPILDAALEKCGHLNFKFCGLQMIDEPINNRGLIR